MWARLILAALVSATATATYRPIVGILSQEMPPVLKNYSAYIPASYVKALEASGARVVPIAIGKSEQYYEDILYKINGVVFPGGGDINFTAPGGFGEAGTHIVNAAKKLNERGDHFPIMGVCLGYELLMYISSNDYDILTKCHCENIALPLQFLSGFYVSRLYNRAPSEVIDILATLPVTSNHHQFCVTIEKLKKHKLEKEWLVLSTNMDYYGLEFVSSSESVSYPFVGLQFHPEKNAYEWNPNQWNPHTRKAIYSARYFYDWIVEQARRNNHSFPTDEEELETLIYNYSPAYLGKYGGYNEQVYFFN